MLRRLVRHCPDRQADHLGDVFFRGSKATRCPIGRIASMDVVLIHPWGSSEKMVGVGLGGLKHLRIWLELLIHV